MFPELQAQAGKFFTFRQVGQNFAAELGEMAKDQSIVPPLAPSGRGLSAKPTGGEKSLWRLSLRRPAGDTSLTEGGKREGQSSSPTHFVSDGLLLSVATKVTKNAIQGERDFDLPLPFGKPHPGVGDYQIAPLPRSGKGRWRPMAAVGEKEVAFENRLSLFGNTLRGWGRGNGLPRPV